ncbi:MAG: hypothetical protein V4670_10210 [Bacteroidota bacterium]
MSKKIKRKRKKINDSFKVLIILLTTTLLASFFYIYKMSDRSKKIIVSLRQEKLELVNEKQAILNDLEKSKIYLEKALSNKSSLTDQLKKEKEKVDQLIAQIKSIKNTEIDNTQIEQFKQNAENSDAKITLLIKELDRYKKKVDSTNVVLKKERKAIDTLKNSNKKLSSKITEATKLYFYDLKIAPLKLRSSGNEITTEKANKVDIIKVSFMIAQNDFVKSTTKEFYIQIIDSKNNVIGDKKVENFGKDILTYSATSKIKYDSKTIEVEREIPVSELEKGTYFINVFDKAKLILNTTLTLK